VSPHGLSLRLAVYEYTCLTWELSSFFYWPFPSVWRLFRITPPPPEVSFLKPHTFLNFEPQLVEPLTSCPLLLSFYIFEPFRLRPLDILLTDFSYLSRYPYLPLRLLFEQTPFPPPKFLDLNSLFLHLWRRPLPPPFLTLRNHPAPFHLGKRRPPILFSPPIDASFSLLRFGSPALTVCRIPLPKPCRILRETAFR